jgi:hypothetical protein
MAAFADASSFDAARQRAELEYVALLHAVRATDQRFAFDRMTPGRHAARRCR